MVAIPVITRILSDWFLYGFDVFRTFFLCFKIGGMKHGFSFFVFWVEDFQADKISFKADRCFKHHLEYQIESAACVWYQVIFFEDGWFDQFSQK